jgi:hypothetical protein
MLANIVQICINILVTLQNSAAKLSLTATCVAAVVLRVFRRISAAFPSLISPSFLPTIHREFKKLDSSTLPVASTSSVCELHIQYEFAATVARVSYTFTVRVCVLQIKYEFRYYSSVCCVTDSGMMNVSCIQQLVAGYEQRLRSTQRVALFSYGRRILRDDGGPNRFIFCNLFSDRETAIEFLKEVGLIRSKTPCKTCGQVWCGPLTPIFAKDSAGDVTGRMPEPGAISLRPSGTGHGSSGVI